MRQNNPPGFDRLSLPAEYSSLDTFQEFVQERAESAGLPPSAYLKIVMVQEEVLLNIFKNAYPPERQGLVELACGQQEDGQGFLVRYTDQGRPFDPLSAPPPDVTLDIDDREEGGLGILLMKKMSRSQHYQREGDSNILELVFDP
ncbi:Anti-sigma regulatory factor (Ser/Thr protein kinase) [Desulfonatronum thiosulfatophilum]|uniref:Anti-sigma regulatory factor (Ser/Thr protein kinase) n=1 Tax=Desulfonatronum thiosulfatophilum TaxID=617002 RepID=A0A1G6CHC1_9BACT|nr:ATP-binding protein [Desulfonatronum thiosulfatophilum]SDB32175.1 Anti-sigma regulatory factor (Ser/Thr protein kinase) [Desulfonatronum thiosulfatophilum]